MGATGWAVSGQVLKRLVDVKDLGSTSVLKFPLTRDNRQFSFEKALKKSFDRGWRPSVVCYLVPTSTEPVPPGADVAATTPRPGPRSPSPAAGRGWRISWC